MSPLFWVTVSQQTQKPVSACWDAEKAEPFRRQFEKGESLTACSLLKVVCGTDTLGVLSD